MTMKLLTAATALLSLMVTGCTRGNLLRRRKVEQMYTRIGASFRSLVEHGSDLRRFPSLCSTAVCVSGGKRSRRDTLVAFLLMIDSGSVNCGSSGWASFRFVE